MTEPAQTAIWWVRQDLRLADNPALLAAVACGSVIPVFVWAPEDEGAWAPGGASRWWLHESLAALARELEKRGSRLILARGPAADVLPRFGADAVIATRRYEPAARAQEEAVAAVVPLTLVDGALLRAPDAVKKKDGTPYSVFTPYARAFENLEEPPEPVAAPKTVPAPRKWPASVALEELALMPRIPWHKGLAARWTPGEAAAQKALSHFANDVAAKYTTTRDIPAVDGTSLMSPRLHFGEISPRAVWHATSKAKFRSELLWREFSHQLLWRFPHFPEQPLRSEFARFPWSDDDARLAAWQRGRTGYPIVDAGMRELWQTGFMHNRVRMIVASFLVKHLTRSWTEGAAWFWDTLVDADLANNSQGWQWSAGCGVDAAPYFRVFNPVLQGEKFDRAGEYVRRYVPELAELPAKWIHKPWEAPREVLSAAGVVLGKSYPRPMVDHKKARAAALFAYDKVKSLPRQEKPARS